MLYKFRRAAVCSQLSQSQARDFVITKCEESRRKKIVVCQLAGVIWCSNYDMCECYSQYKTWKYRCFGNIQMNIYTKKFDGVIWFFNDNMCECYSQYNAWKCKCFENIERNILQGWLDGSKFRVIFVFIANSFWKFRSDLGHGISKMSLSSSFVSQSVFKSVSPSFLDVRNSLWTGNL